MSIARERDGGNGHRRGAFRLAPRRCPLRVQGGRVGAGDDGAGVVIERTGARCGTRPWAPAERLRFESFIGPLSGGYAVPRDVPLFLPARMAFDVSSVPLSETTMQGSRASRRCGRVRGDAAPGERGIDNRGEAIPAEVVDHAEHPETPARGGPRFGHSSSQPWIPVIP